MDDANEAAVFRPVAGFSLIEVLIAIVVLALASMIGAAYAVRGSSDADWNRDRAFAHQKALSLLAELRGMVGAGESDAAADLEYYDDAGTYVPSLTLTRELVEPYALLAPDNPVSGNVRNGGVWRWSRSISIEEFDDQERRDRRRCTVRIYRRLPHEAEPGIQMAEVSGVIQSMEDPLAGGHVYDLYVLDVENVPSPWVPADGVDAYISSVLSDLRSRNPGLDFRVHRIKRLGYGRDREYAPYGNVSRLTTEDTPWAYVYPGTLPADASRITHYAPETFGARFNRDGKDVPNIKNFYRAGEAFEDANGNGILDDGEVYGDLDGDQTFDAGNDSPYALADQHNHAMRWPDARRHHAARVAAHLESELTWRLLLDDLIRNPDEYKNALFLNLHGHLLPMPPVRNYSDAAKVPNLRQGWRAVTHPERLRSSRVAGDDAASEAPRFRVYAYKTAFKTTEQIMTQGEPLVDANVNGIYDDGEHFEDWNGNGVYDAGLPITVSIWGADFSARANDDTAPTIRVLSLTGGVDADGDGAVESYAPFTAARMLPEAFTDTNGDGIWNPAEPWYDIDGDGIRGAHEPFADLDGNGVYSATAETMVDTNGNGTWEQSTPEEVYEDANGNGRWDPAEPYWDVDGDGKYTKVKDPVTPYVPFNPVHYGNTTQLEKYVKDYGEPFFDMDGDGEYDKAEKLEDANGNGVHDHGYRRGEMYFTIRYDAVEESTILELHGTPLEAPADATGAGLAESARLYDLDYIPCPTPASAADANRFGRDLSVSGAFPKNTARWIIELPTPAIRGVLASSAGANDGDLLDRIFTVESRIGTDLGTGSVHPGYNAPANRSRTYAWFCDSPEDVPYSERFQFQGDPRHSPYADSDATGLNYANGYNPYFAEFEVAAMDAEKQWLALDGERIQDRWAGRADFDVPRYMDWLRRGLTNAEALFTNLGGLGFEALSLGGDIGGDGPGLDGGVLMDGRTFGRSEDVVANTLFEVGTSGVAGHRNFVRSGIASNSGRRAGGAWWSKPWLGELCPDEVFVDQWSKNGNLKAGTGTDAKTFRQVGREGVPADQLPAGTELKNARGELGVLGGTAFFNVGSAGATFQQSSERIVARVVGDGYDLGARYGMALPTGVAVNHPFLLSWGGDQKVNGLAVGPGFGDTTTFPHYSAELATRYYSEQARTDTLVGSGVLRHTSPSGNVARIGVSSLYEGTEEGVAFLGRYALLSLVQAYTHEGHPDVAHRTRQLASLEITAPAKRHRYSNPATIAVTWSTKWARWDGAAYGTDYPEGFEEDEGDLVYRLLYSWNDGGSWFHMQDGSETVPGRLPRLLDGSVDPSVTVRDTNTGEESFTWSTPIEDVPDASYLVRIEAYHVSEPTHYSYHEERFDVSR